MNQLERRIRKLEKRVRAAVPTGRAHIVLLRPGASLEAERAKISDLVPGDELIVVRFVRPGDLIAPVLH